MKKVIQGARYDTSTAREIGSWSNGYYPGDLYHCTETLYQTKSGKYFLHGSGGPASKYSRQTGSNSWSGGEEIVPMSPAAAAKWAEEYLPSEIYEKEFGEVPEASDDKVAVMLSLPVDVKARLERLRSETGKSISQLVAEKFKEG